MIVLDTCALIYDALTPEKLSAPAKRALHHAENEGQLFCCAISLWEIAMLIQKKRLDPGTDIETFLQLLLDARQIQVFDINVKIATLSVSHAGFNHFDPADRIIAATTLYWDGKLVTSDKHLHHVSGLNVIW